MSVQRAPDVEAHCVSWDQAAKIVSTVRARLSRQCGKRKPKTDSNLAQSSREFAGRRAGVGNSAVVIGAIDSGALALCRDASSKTARASPCQLVSPEPAA